MEEQVFWNSCSALSIARSLFPTGSYAWTGQDLVLVPKPNRFTTVNNNQPFTSRSRENYTWEKAVGQQTVSRVLVITFPTDCFSSQFLFFSFNANQHSPNNVRVANKCSSARDSFPSKIARAPVENSQSKSTCREDREKKRIPVLCFLLGTIFVCASPSKSMRFSLCVSACANASPTATVSARFRCCCLDATKCTSRTPKGKIWKESYVPPGLLLLPLLCLLFLVTFCCCCCCCCRCRLDAQLGRLIGRRKLNLLFPLQHDSREWV